jgi:cytochrome c peroxidase
MPQREHLAAATALLFTTLGASFCRAEVPAVPVPVENPVTEAKRVLGKILFWEEQLSSDDTVACGTCHIPAYGGTDPRRGIHPGKDPGTIDNVLGSPGIVAMDHDGRPVDDPVFGREVQVTGRFSQPNFGGLWADEVFWDGRAGSRLIDPVSGETAIESGGALENQVLIALSSSVEMASKNRPWEELAAKLRSASPLALATEWPADVSRAIAVHRDYPSLFRGAFGDATITPIRIAFAIATYERTVVADQTPWDRYVAGDESAMTAREIAGWQDFQTSHCTACHVPPLFTSNEFLNIGLRRAEYDEGRMAVTGVDEDAGEFKVPSLRNVSLRSRFMHTGQFDTLSAAVGFYRNTIPFAERDAIPGIGVYSFNLSTISETNITEFLANALTDPRVAAEQFPFDRPILGSERAEGDVE